jgi:hypothetical protein
LYGRTFHFSRNHCFLSFSLFPALLFPSSNWFRVAGAGHDNFAKVSTILRLLSLYTCVSYWAGDIVETMEALEKYCIANANLWCELLHPRHILRILNFMAA